MYEATSTPVAEPKVYQLIGQVRMILGEIETKALPLLMPSMPENGGKLASIPMSPIEAELNALIEQAKVLSSRFSR